MEFLREESVIETGHRLVPGVIARQNADGCGRAEVIREGKKGEANVGRRLLHGPAWKDELANFNPGFRRARRNAEDHHLGAALVDVVVS